MELPAKEGTSFWRIRDAVEGVQIFGGIGSGKTSGSGRTLALKYLAAGFGGLVLTAKADEKDTWKEYCALAGRSEDLIIVEPGGKNYFNFLEYESSHSDKQRASSLNIVQVLKTVINASEEKTGGKKDDQFWESALDMLISHSIDLCLLAYNKVSVQLLYDIVQTSPAKETDLSEEEQKKSAFNKAFEAAKKNAQRAHALWVSKLPEPKRTEIMDSKGFSEEEVNEVPELREFSFIDQFFNESLRKLGEKTRSIIEFSFCGFLFNLLREPIFSLFCRHESTFTPDDCLNGKIILINLPVKLYHKVGRDSQILFKYIWQRAMERRNVKENDRPVFLWADEAQNFLHEYDAEYQATARSSLIATVYISQNLPNYYANMGGLRYDYRVKSFLGTLGTKIFHANADIETNKYASELIGDFAFEEDSTTATAAGKFSSSRTTSLKIDRIVRPEHFTKLKTGGQENKLAVQGYVHVQGYTIKGPFNYVLVVFKQDFVTQS